MTQDDTAGGAAPTDTAMDITPKPGAPEGGAAVPPPSPAPAAPAPKDPTTTAMDITPRDKG